MSQSGRRHVKMQHGEPVRKQSDVYLTEVWLVYQLLVYPKSKLNQPHQYDRVAQMQ